MSPDPFDQEELEQPSSRRIARRPMRNVLICDTETTGLEPRDHVCIEVAAVIFNVDEGEVLSSYGTLIRTDRKNDAAKVNRISDSLIKFGREGMKAWEEIGQMSCDCYAYVAHRAEFDRSFFPPSLRTNLPWICSKFDLDWPRQDKPGAGLVHIALGLGLGVAHAHRAMSDCDTLARCLTRVKEMGVDLEKFLARGLRPKATFQALVSYEEREKAKEHAFQWDPQRKMWLRSMAIDDALALPFKVLNMGAMS